MAILHRKEEKIQVVLGRLPQSYTDEEFVKMFIKLYGKDWGKIRAAYLKQSQDKEPGTVVTMPKPELYLKQLAEIYLKANPPKTEEIKEKVVTDKVKKVAVKKSTTAKEGTVEPKVKKVAVKKDAIIAQESIVLAKKAKTTIKDKVESVAAPTPKKKNVAKK